MPKDDVFKAPDKSQVVAEVEVVDGKVVVADKRTPEFIEFNIKEAGSEEDNGDRERNDSGSDSGPAHVPEAGVQRKTQYGVW